MDFSEEILKKSFTESNRSEGISLHIHLPFNTKEYEQMRTMYR